MISRRLVISVGLLAACGAPTTTMPEARVAEIEIVGDDEPLFVGQSRQLGVTLRDATGKAVTGRTVTWHSADTTVLRVTGTGSLLAWRHGTGAVIASVDGHADTLTLPLLAPKVAGMRFVLARFDGRPAPFLVRDLTSGDGVRRRHFFLADTIRFDAQDRLTYRRDHRWMEEGGGLPSDTYDDAESGGGWFIQLDGRVSVAWNYLSVPPDEAYADHLELRGDGLIRRMQLPPSCPTCPAPSPVELVYLRQ